MNSRTRSMKQVCLPGAQKGAHYSAPLPFGTPARPPPARPRKPLLAALLLSALAGAAGLPAAPGHPEADARKAEQELQGVRAEIERITREVSAEQVERDRLTHELKSAEVSVGKARAALADVRRERAEDAARRAALTVEKHARQSELEQNRAALEGQLRAAYLIGRQEPLKLLLNQKDPALAGRMFVYYSYFGRARAGQIHLIENDVQRLTELDGELAAEDDKLAALEQQQRAQLADLEQARTQRSHLLARLGDARAGGVRWDGVLVATERGTPVKAVCQGRIIYADWLPGLGLLAIVDHGDGYLSLYGHNERLYKAAGEHVEAGDTIAAAGDSGGSPRPELYFEIRKAGKPVDPRPWFNSPDP